MNRSLNAVYSKPSMRRRYEVWFVRLGLADGSGAWWFRYLFMNLGRPEGGGCRGNARGMPAQVWATWFPRGAKPQSFIQGFPRKDLALSKRGASPFHLEIRDNRITEDSCSGHVAMDGHDLRWSLRYHSTFGTTLSDKGWIGFSRTPHSNAIFSGEILFDDRVFHDDPLGYGLQGHNCGYRHRDLWNWTHCIFPREHGRSFATFEALEYAMPFGLRFRKAILWLDGVTYTFKRFESDARDRENLQWKFACADPKTGARVIDGSGPSLHRLPYLKTDCSSTFEVSNNSLARAMLTLTRPGRPPEELATDGGAVLEMAGD
jgi:hypothetical protein